MVTEKTAEADPKKSTGVDIPKVDDRFLDIVAADIESNDADREFVDSQKKQLGGSFFSSLISTLTGMQKDEEEAEELWEKLLKHKYAMSTMMGRNVGIKVAAVDYFTNIEPQHASIQMVDREAFLKTTEMAITDGLTHLYNHRYFQDRLREELRKATDSNEPLSVILLDIDYFKDYNDINGHVAGDVALHEVASIIASEIDNNGICCRYGGEEFAVILPITGKRTAAQFAEIIRSSIDEHHFPNEFVLPSGNLTISIGVAEFPLDATDSRNLVEYADRTMYSAKRNGKNQVCLLAPNRRKQKRLLYKAKLFVEIANDSAELLEIPAFTEDVSAGGVLCKVNRKLSLNQAVQIRFVNEPEIGGKQFICVVSRTERVSHSEWNIGLRFARLTPADEEVLHKFVVKGFGEDG
jgi:diguanylate cyclase (GGDEF)-like protein